ncbi:13493_t:CDS:2 [Dentiscutata erythropus]|uniref:13493_t:CDS:1 n=1 Tax=Dentiscutata erythropus TaxID=1348616 RepID=A0A9N9JDH7_9GLOM|nr:13493_t:CDS:2 [Dentiscutata erythropus]
MSTRVWDSVVHDRRNQLFAGPPNAYNVSKYSYALTNAAAINFSNIIQPTLPRTRWKTATEFQANSTGLSTYNGRYVRYRVCEHAMTAAMNGLAAYGGIIPFGGSFLNFISYGSEAVRLSALSSFREDGPTHQPIETAADLRALPNLLFLIPADGNEVSGVYLIAIKNIERPSALALSRPNVPNLERSSIEGTVRGGYILKDCHDAQIILTGTLLMLQIY